MQSHIVWLAVAVILPLNAGCGGQLTPTPSPIFDGLMLNYILPAAGNPDGSTSVTLAGGVFQAGATVTFDGIPASEVVVNSGTEIRARTPPHGEGTEGYPSIIFVIQNDRLVHSAAIRLRPSRYRLRYRFRTVNLRTRVRVESRSLAGSLPRQRQRAPVRLARARGIGTPHGISHASARGNMGG